MNNSPSKSVLRIFLSYSHEDSDFGAKLVEDLRHAFGNNVVWYYPHGEQDSGDLWRRKVVRELQSCNVFIVVLSPASIKSPKINAEIDLAWRQHHRKSGKLILPLLYRKCEIRSDLDMFQIVSFLSPKTYDNAFQELQLALMQAQRSGSLQRELTRRVVIGALATVGVLTGGFALEQWWSHTQAQTSSTDLTADLTPTPIPRGGNLLYTYLGHSSGQANGIGMLLWSSDSKRIASSSDTVQIWDAYNGGHAYTYHGSMDITIAIAWSPDGKRIASTNNETVQVWNAADGSPVFTYSGHTDGIRAVAWSPDGKHIASASYDKTVQVWNAADGSPVFTYSKHTDAVLAVAWSPDSRRIASTSINEKTVQVWDATYGTSMLIYQGHSDNVLSLAWSPEGRRIASGSQDTTVQVWDTLDGNHIYTYHGHDDRVNAVVWSPYATRLASGSADGTVQVWGADDGDQAYAYRGHDASVNTVGWAPSSKYIASGGEDKRVQVWSPG